MARDPRWSSWRAPGALQFLGITLGLAVVLAVLATVRYVDRAPLRQADLPVVTAVVTESHPTGRKPRIDVRYVAEGQPRTATIQYGSRVPAAGSMIDLRYAPGDPEKVRPADPSYRTNDVRDFWVALVPVVIGLVVVPLRIRRARRH